MSRRIANLTGSGISGGAATYLNGTASDGATAAGSTQTTALAMPGDNVAVTTTAASTGIILPVCSPGDEQFIANLGANALTVYPPVGDAINALSANAGYSLAAGKSAFFVKTGAARWCSLLSA